jgi:hypothetical protein
MEGYCSTGQSPQRAVVPVEEEEYVSAIQTEYVTTSANSCFRICQN